MAFDRRLATNFDWGTLAFSLAIIALSIVLLYSATSERSEGPSGMHVKQLLWTGMGLVSMFAVLCIDYQTLCRHAYVLYGALLLSLVIVLLFGRVVHGLPFGLIIKQPNLSTAMVLMVILCVMVLMVGLHRKTLLTLFLLGAGALPAAWSLLLKDYQRERLLTLLNPQPDLLGAGYHSWQSKIAIGSGGLWGKGLLAGTQSRLSFLPERHTDFIFAVLAEEVGFVGVLLLMCLFGCLLVHGFTIAYRSRDRMGALIATGVVTMLAVQIFLNIGMTVGLVPIIGLPLPLMSYGGSSLVMTFLCLGLLMNVRMRRFQGSAFPS